MKEFFIDSDGTRLHAKLDRPEGMKKGPLCILIHGFTGDMEEEHLIAARDAMMEAGVAVLRAEMYGHGGSDGEFRKHTLYKWVTNAIDVVNYAKSLDFVTDLYLSGHSQGGLLTMLVGGMFPDDFKAIIPLSPAWMIPENAREGIILGMTFDPEHIPDDVPTIKNLTLGGNYIRVAQTVYAEETAARYKGPVLILQGDEDDMVPVQVSARASERYAQCELAVIPGETHHFDRYPEEMAWRIRSFCEKIR